MRIQMLFCFLTGIAASILLQRCIRLMPVLHQLLFSLLAGFLFCFARLYLPWGYQLFLVWIFLFGLITEAYIDFRQKIILDEVLLLLLTAGLTYATASGNSWHQSLFGALAGMGLLGLVYILSKGGIGFGDVKFAGVLGLWTGVQGILVNLYLAFFIGGAAAFLLCMCHKATLKNRIPFGPCLSAGAILSFFFSSRILEWYWSLFL